MCITQYSEFISTFSLNIQAHLLVLNNNFSSAKQNLEKINGPSDEMELLSHVNRRFKTVFAKQEEQKTWPTYDKLEVSISSTETEGIDVSPFTNQTKMLLVDH